ncbi:MAG TPA: biosynthetic arginine decarboxylase [Thermoanaerobaculia bacterium]|nr:biosynthetic arginine decarboxylase [Thermoanaerobaculia bacterium]
MTTHTEEFVEQKQRDWSVEDASSLYMIDRWGGGYFGVNGGGDLTVSPLQEKGVAIPIMDVLQEARILNLNTPLLIRFQDLLRHRVQTLNDAFNRAIAEQKYQGMYRGVFPIKVNQLREVVEEILDAGKPYNYGLEVGSKPEIFAGLAVHSDPESLIVCNGYKDASYIRMALLGRRLGKKVILIAEKLSEVRAITRIAAEMNVQPWIGMRVRLLSKGAGKWATSGGEHAKFGLSTAEILEAMEILREAQMESAFKLLHFHIGSQIPDILTIKRAVREAAMYFAKLHKLGQSLEYIDVGGGLAIDYDGSRSTFHSSMNYSIEEYANDIVYNIMDICDDEKVPHPNIVSESGRAIVAHHSVLVVQAFGAIEKTPVEPREMRAADHKLIRELIDIDRTLSEAHLNEAFHDLVQIKEQSQTMFELGLLDLDVKARLESLFWQVAERIQKIAERLDPADVPEDIKNLKIELADQHICNFSVFQSLLDHWALGQLFPIVPIHRLNERPQLESTLVDITCDSDGKVSKYIDLNDVRETLPLHELRDGQPYYLGIFLTGAYQDIMGDIHNLFGRVNEVHVFLDEDEDSGFYIEEEIPGQPIGEVLAMTQYDWRDLEKRMKAQIDAAIKQDRVKPTEGMRLLQDYERGLKDQTYLTLD